MTTSADIQRGIVLALASEEHGMDMFKVASMTDQAPFRVRAELKALKRTWLVTEEVSPIAHKWALTARGWQTYHQLLQLTTSGALR